MEMGRSASGGGKVVTFDDAVAGRRRNGSLSSYYLDVVGNKDVVDAGRAARLLPTHGMGTRRRTYADGELDVFTAERYFKGAMDGGGGYKEAFADPAAAAALPVEKAAARPAEDVVVAKPSSTRASTVSVAASSASSANSQTVLFRGRHERRGSRDKKCCVQVGVLMRTCSGKRSVRVDGGATTKEAHGAGEPATSRIDWYRELRMQKAAHGLPGDGNSHGLVAAGLPPIPPSLSLGTAKVAAIGRELTRDDEKAAELTRSSSTGRSFSLVAPVRTIVPTSGRVGVAVGAAKCGDDDEDDDDGSESSSDLFEIKSLMIEDCCPYEPSEASIQWSVVTASAADASERGDRVPARWASAAGGGRGPVAGRQYRDHRPVGLLAGCASQRAVDVSPATKAVPNVAAAMQRRGDGFQKAQNGP